MSGVMIKVAIYGLFRFLFDMLYPWQLEWGILILVIGSISSLVGVLYALSEDDIKALLANSSIENIGIILIGFGMGMIFDSLGLKTLSAFSFIASLFHIFNHMSFKSLLFMGAGSVLYQTHTKNIEKYGALIKSMPITAWSFLLASISVSALPPSNGFLSEWMTFQALLGSQNIADMSLKLTIPFAVFSLALTSGLAIACFVKAFGITFLGLHRSENAKHAKEVNALMSFGMVLMSLIVVSLMMFAPFYIYNFDQALVSLGRESVYEKIFIDGIFTLHSVGNNGGVISPLLLLGVLVGITSLLVAVYKALDIKTRIHRTWACGNTTSSNTQYSATGFAGPIRRFFYWLYKHKESIKKENLFGYETKFSAAEYKMHVQPLFEQTLYSAPVRAVNIISFWIYKLAHFEKTRYAAMIFNLLLIVLFSYRIFAHEFSWATLVLESVVMIISVKILVIGDEE
jgi:hydrogenase-4 component B